MKKLLLSDTICIHSGREHSLPSSGIITPIEPSSVYDYRDVGIIYPRYFNTSNQKVIVQKLASLEKTDTGFIFGSGMAAISSALFSFLKEGDHVIFSDALYGGTDYFATHELSRHGISYTLLDALNTDNIIHAIQPNTKVIYIETPSNPLLKVLDIESIARIAKTHNLVSMIDSTFASPINQNPHTLGMDIVLHSGTKYLGGHSDLCFGALLCSQKHHKIISKHIVSYGGSLNPLDCYLIERSLKTLSLRITKQNENAMALATFLDKHKNVNKVYYPGLSSHPNHNIAKKNMSGYGGMLSFELKGDNNVLNSFLEKLEIIQPAISLGGVETIVCIPAQTSHQKMSVEDRKKVGISDTLIRVSVGVEHIDDLIADIDQALKIV